MNDLQDEQEPPKEPHTATTPAGESPATKPTLSDVWIDYLDQLEDVCRDEILQRMRQISGQRLTLIDLSEAYQDGIAALGNYLAVNGPTVTLADGTDGYIKLAYRFFERATQRRMRRRSKRMTQRQPDPEAHEGTWADRPTVMTCCPTTGTWTKETDNAFAETTPTTDLEHQDLVELLHKIFDEANLEPDELELFDVYLKRAPELDKRSRYPKLACFLKEKYNPCQNQDGTVTPDVTPEEVVKVEKRWTAAVKKLRMTTSFARLLHDWGDIGRRKRHGKLQPHEAIATA